MWYAAKSKIVPTPGKNFPGQKGFPTPNSTPDDSVRRIFIVPNSDEWLGLLEGAVQVLLDEWRYYDWGEMTPAEAAIAFNSIVLASYSNVCPPGLPGGGSVIRINPSTGHLEQGVDDGWASPTGDYAVPAITPREGGTPDDQRCLASANAANVLQTLYESITDSIAHGLELAEAYAALVTAFIAAVGWEFAPIAFALAAFFLAVFAVVYEIIQLIGADLWDGTFTDTLKCALLTCSSVDAGVVTFDWPCVQNTLAAGTDALSFDQLRLFNQLNFIIQAVGGADGLNQAGATTAITDADCSGCAGEFCHEWFDIIGYTDIITPDTWTYTRRYFISIPNIDVDITRIEITWEALPNPGNTDNHNLVEVYNGSDPYGLIVQDVSAETSGTAAWTFAAGTNVYNHTDGMNFEVLTAYVPTGANYPNISHILIRYVTPSVTWPDGSDC